MRRKISYESKVPAGHRLPPARRPPRVIEMGWTGKAGYIMVERGERAFMGKMDDGRTGGRTNKEWSGAEQGRWTAERGGEFTRATTE